MQAQQLQLQAQVQAQQLQLQTQVEGLKKQLDDLTNRSDKTPSWAERYLPVTVSIIAAALSCLFFVLTRALNKEIAKRTVRIEAQKLLVEINKQYLSNPALFAIYDDLANMEELSQDREALQER